jgi:predicted site-specific integrase-resolvase
MLHHMGKRPALAVDLIGANEAAEILGVSRWTVQRLTSQGVLHVVHDLARGRVYDRRQVQAVAAYRREEASA